jgi:hypothetical protein
MLRPLSATIAAALQYPNLQPAFFISAQFNDGPTPTTIYAWNGVGNYVLNSNTYSGLGSVLSISVIETAADGSSGITARNVVLTVSGLDPILANAAESNFLQGGALTISLALFDPSGNMIAIPSQIFGGQMDTASLSGDGKQSTISFSIENRLVDLNRSRERLYTPADVRIEHPLDMAFFAIYDVSQIPVYFGSQPSKTNNQING